MSEYLCDCHKCTNKYYRQHEDGTTAYWCRPAIDTGIVPLIVEGMCGKDFVIRCDKYTTDAVAAPLPAKYPW